MPITPADRASRRAGGRALCAVETLPASGSGPGAGVLMGWRQGYYSDQCVEDPRPEDAGRDRRVQVRPLVSTGLGFSTRTTGTKKGGRPGGPATPDGGWKEAGASFTGIRRSSAQKVLRDLVSSASAEP